MGNKEMEEIVRLLKKNSQGLTITELVDKSKFSRSLVRIVLARLEGANSVLVRKVGMAKVYTVREEK